MVQAAQTTSKIIASAKGKVLFIDEAYGLDPSRRNNTYGGDVLDTLTEKLDGAAGSDMAVIMAGYHTEMASMFRNSGNQGLTRRFNLEEALVFEDFSDEDLKRVLMSGIRKESLRAEPSTIDLAVSQISQRRRLDGFGNAAEAEKILMRAKVKLSSRKQKAAENKARRSRPVAASQQTGRGGGALRSLNSFGPDEQDPVPAEEDCECDPYLLIDEDFIAEETSAEKAREAISDLENVEHVMAYIQELEDTIEQAKSEGRAAAEILDDMHMIFTGPPGTGKTTVAQRFGVMFKNLGLLPRSDVEVVTAANLIDRYVGGTENNVKEAMQRAKGGILFIDEAYGMVPGKGSYGGNALQALLDNVTTPEFRGNIIVILAGYAEHVEELFGVNPGFRSRFDKKRLEFPEWSADMAARATIKEVEKNGLGLSSEAKELLPVLYKQLSDLPDWGSARDVYRLILPSMYSKRSSRLGQLARLQRQEDEVNSAKAVSGGAVAASVARKSRREIAAEKNKKPVAAPYEAQDVRAAFSSALKSRSGGSMDDSQVGTVSSGSTDANTAAASAQSSSDAGGQSSNKGSRVQTIGNLAVYNRMITQSKNDGHLLVVDFSASWCPPSQEMKPYFERMSRQFMQVKFAIADSDKAPDVFRKAGVQSMPTLKLFMDGREVATKSGFDESWLRQKIVEFSRLARQNANNSPPALTAGDNQGLAPPPQPPVKQKVRLREEVQHKAPDMTPQQPSRDVWAALEEACAELGYSLEKIEEFLTSGDYPDELLVLVMSKTGVQERSAIVDILNGQKGPFLDKVRLYYF